MPELTELSKNLIIQETKDGLDVALVDQSGRSMFADGSSEPQPFVRDALIKLAGPIRKLSNRIAITGHTARPATDKMGEASPWDLSVSRAAAVRTVLSEAGLPRDRFALIAGKADTEPLFPDNPTLAANRRIDIVLLREPPPLPIQKKF